MAENINDEQKMRAIKIGRRTYGIILERWDVMLICIVVATIASLVSARFANRVKNHTVGLVTGIVLTVLGAAMLILNYRSIISGIAG